MAKPEQCGHCKKPATIHLTQIVNNQIHKVDLCEDCPYKQNVTDPEAFSLADFLLKPQVLGSAQDRVRCEVCGFTPADFKKLGRFGCPHCYESFKGMLRPMLTGMHRGLEHQGKVPERVLSRLAYRTELSELRRALDEAVEEENYEEAARLRDLIHQKEASETPSGH
ncbi:MAG: UvrB/UvrC motif-containing protein [Opitutales bacterium]